MGKTKRGKGTKIIRWQTALVFFSPYASLYGNKLVEKRSRQGSLKNINMIATIEKVRLYRMEESCKRRWTVERLFAWLQNFRHLVVR
jgi:transposase